MTTDQSAEEERIAQKDRHKPALGLHITPDTDSDALAGAICRADQHGHDVLVVVGTDVDNEARIFADELGATVIEIESQYVTDTTHPREDLLQVARMRGYPGVIWQPDQTLKIDFDRSVAHLHDSNDYWTDAKERPAVGTTPRVLVAIPAHNEAQTIEDVIIEARQHADEVLVVDDGSSDNTAARAEAAVATVIQHEMNQGYGGALKTAFREAERCGAEHLVILDGDGQHDPADIPRLVQVQQDTGAEIVVGDRFNGETNLPLYRRIGLGVINLMTNLSMGVVRSQFRVRDTQSGFRAYDRQAIETLAADNSIGDHMGASTDILYHAHSYDYRIEEVGTTIDYDVEDASTRAPVSHGITLVQNILRTVEKERPVSLIGIPGFVSVCLGLGFGYWTGINYLQSQIFPLGLAVASTVFLLAGVFACFTAIILHSLKTHLDE